MTTLAVPRNRLVSPALACVFMAEFGALTSLYLLLSVLPRYVGGAGAGVTTAALMATTVVGELLTPRLVTRFGYRGILAAGLLLLGVPTLALPFASVAGVGLVFVVCVLRGAGLAVIFVVSGALGAALIPPERRGEGLGVFGAVVSLPALIGTPLGVWLADRAGYPVVFLIAAASALASLGALGGLPKSVGAAVREEGVVAVARRPGMVRVSLVFGATAVAAGVLITLLPVALPRSTGDLAALALLLNAGTGALARWWAGRIGDRHGAHRLLVPGLLLTAAGMVGLLALSDPVAVLASSVLVGAGFGVSQNASMTVLLQRVPASAFTAATALWSIAYDGGFGLGALAVGAVALQTGFPVAFAATGLLAVAALGLLVRSRLARPTNVTAVA